MHYNDTRTLHNKMYLCLQMYSFKQLNEQKSVATACFTVQSVIKINLRIKRCTHVHQNVFELLPPKKRSCALFPSQSVLFSLPSLYSR